jgi:alanine-synthesizing transaminase
MVAPAFSSRLPPILAPNAVSRAVARLRGAGATLLDLTQTNPTEVGIAYPLDALSGLADPLGLHYTPGPRGLVEAREAVADDYLRRGQTVSSERIVLTSSTSEAYAVLFKLLCDPGDAVLVPQPSYPLFDLLTRLDGVVAQPYRLDHHGVWTIDRVNLELALTHATRAVLVVSPNNPTGAMLRSSDRDWLAELCEARGLALIADEVFAPYPLAPRPDACSVIGEQRVLTFSLGGLSKSAGLPQVKLGWVVVDGPPHLVRETLERIDLICDTYLSVSTPVQVAASRLIETGRVIRAAIGPRLDRNLHELRRRLAASPSISLLEPEGGWSAVLRVPATQPEEALVLRVLEEAHVIVHPGYFFDFAHEAFVVLSLLPEPRVFDEGVDRLLPLLAGGRS